MNRMSTRVALVLTCLGLMALVPIGRSTHATSLAPFAGAGVQQLVCTMYTLDPTSRSFSASGGSGSVFVDTGPNGGSCIWRARSSDSWITPGGGPDHVGDSDLLYTVAANNSFARNGTIQILAEPGDNLVATFSVSQDGVSNPGVMEVCATDVPKTSAFITDFQTSTIRIDKNLLVDHVSVKLFFTAP